MELADSIDIKSMPPRPSYGSQGEEFEVFTNHLPVTVKPIQVYRYSIQVSLNGRDVFPSDPLLSVIIEKYFSANFNDQWNQGLIVTDFKKFAFATVSLPMGHTGSDRNGNPQMFDIFTYDAFRDLGITRIYKIKLIESRAINLGAINHYFEN